MYVELMHTCRLGFFFEPCTLHLASVYLFWDSRWREGKGLENLRYRCDTNRVARELLPSFVFAIVGSSGELS